MNDGLTLSEWEIALNEVLEACVRANDVHRTAARHVEDEALKQELETLARSRCEAADWVGDWLSRHGEGPNRPSEESEMLAEAATWARSALGEGTLLDGCRDVEARVRDAAAGALEHAKDEALRGRLAELRDEAAARTNDFSRRIG